MPSQRPLTVEPLVAALPDSPPAADGAAAVPADPRAAMSRIKADTLVGFVLCHGIALLALLPWFFSWTGVALFAAGVFAFGMLGINIGFHRLLAHRGFGCPRWLERVLALLGTASMQFSPAFWVALHRRHHQFSDRPEDPHSPRHGFAWAHFGWLIRRRPFELTPPVMTERYAKDLMRDPLFRVLERKNCWAIVALAVWGAFFAAGCLIAYAGGSGPGEALQYGASLLVWGGALRTVYVWHTTWAVNSLTHVWGYRTHDTPDDSRNNPLVGILAWGEGWHNTHHHDPVSPRHGQRWWEIDLSWAVIWTMMKLGLASPRRSAARAGDTAE